MTWNTSRFPTDLRATLYVDGKAFDMSKVDHINLTGAKRMAIEVTKGATPSAFSLGEAEPNPFTSTTEISYSLPVDGPVTVKVLNVLGNEVNVLVNTSLTAGVHSTVWDGTAADGSSVLPGVYLYKLEAGDYTATRSLILVK
jgi:flagellar hook assembly protein FlgD